jgi:hypothetical protein
MSSTEYSVAVFGKTVSSFPTWTPNNGQDDLVWYSAKTYSDRQGSYYGTRIPISDHKNETGAYITHIYFDSSTAVGINWTWK